PPGIWLEVQRWVALGIGVVLFDERCGGDAQEFGDGRQCFQYLDSATFGFVPACAVGGGGVAFPYPEYGIDIGVEGVEGVHQLVGGELNELTRIQDVVRNDLQARIRWPL